MTTYVLETTLSHNLVYQVCAHTRVVIYGQALIVKVAQNDPLILLGVGVAK